MIDSVIRLGTVVRADGIGARMMVIGIVRGRVLLVNVEELRRHSCSIDELAFAETYRETDAPPWLFASPEVRIWSFEHNAWWAPGRSGYAPDEASAGLYSREEATQICRDANIACAPGHPHEEIREASK